MQGEIEVVIQSARQRNADVKFKLLSGAVVRMRPGSDYTMLSNGIQWRMGEQLVFVPYEAIAVVVG